MPHVRPSILLLVACLTLPASAESEGAAAMQAKLTELHRRVEELRGLTFKQDVAATIVGDDEVRRYMTERIESFDRADDLEFSNRLYKRLGLME